MAVKLGFGKKQETMAEGQSLAKNVKAELELQRSPLQKVNMFILNLFIFASALGAFINWFLTTLIGYDSLAILAVQFQETAMNEVLEATKGFILPAQLSLVQGYEMAYLEGWDLATRSGQNNMIAFRSAFLRSYFQEAKCCMGIFAHMEYFGIDQKSGQPNENFGNSNEDFFVNMEGEPSDKALFSIVGTAKEADKPHEHKYALYPHGNRSNPLVVESFNATTGMAPDPDRYPLGFVGERSHKGFVNFLKGGLWYRVLKEQDLQEGEVAFSTVFYSSLAGISLHGSIPLWEPSCGIDQSRKVDGLCQGQVQKRVGLMVVGTNVLLLNMFMAKMNLKGGLLFFVERQTGQLVATSIKDFEPYKIIEGEKKVPVVAAESTDSRISSRAKWLLQKANTWREVGTSADTVDFGEEGKQFMYVTELKYFNLDWVAIMSIPEDSVMADINAKKFETLTYGVLIALGVKLLVSLLIKVVRLVVQKRINDVRLEDAARKDVEHGVAVRVASGDYDRPKPDGLPALQTAAAVAAGAATGGVVATATAFV